MTKIKRHAAPFIFCIFMMILVTFIAPPLPVPAQETAGSPTITVPKDFRMTLVSAPLMPGSTAPQLMLTLERTGAAKYYEKWKGTKDFTVKNAFKLNEKDMREIYAMVLKEDFFGLKREYRDPDVKDGDYAVMEITANGKTHRVRTVNIKVGAFDRIYWSVNLHLPKDISITYNALFVKEYKEVER